MKKEPIIDQLITSLEKHIVNKPTELHKKAMEEKKELEEIKIKLHILKKYQGKKIPISHFEKTELSELLCFKNLGYCCKKECPWRNVVLEICGISKDVFEKAKEKLGLALMTPFGIIGTKEHISEEAIVEINRKIQ